MRITPIRYVRNIERSNRFYAMLGLTEQTAATSGTWAELHGEGGGLGLHIAATPSTHLDAGAVSLQFTCDEKLEPLADRLAAAGFEPSAIDSSHPPLLMKPSAGTSLSRIPTATCSRSTRRTRSSGTSATKPANPRP